MNVTVANLTQSLSANVSNLGPRDDDTKDVMQEAILIIIRKLKNEGIKLDCCFSTYFYSICKNIWFEELRRKTRFTVRDNQKFINLADEC